MVTGITEVFGNDGRGRLPVAQRRDGGGRLRGRGGRARRYDVDLLVRPAREREGKVPSVRVMERGREGRRERERGGGGGERERAIERGRSIQRQRQITNGMCLNSILQICTSFVPATRQNSIDRRRNNVKFVPRGTCTAKSRVLKFPLKREIHRDNDPKSTVLPCVTKCVPCVT